MSDRVDRPASRWPEVAPGLVGAAGLFLTIHLGGVAVLSSLLAADVDPGTDPADPQLSLVLVVALLMISAGMLVIFRWGLGWLLRGFVTMVSMGLAWFVYATVLPDMLTLGGLHGPALVLTALTGIGLVAYPRWWVLDLVGIVLGAGAIGLFGLTVGIFPAIVLLVVLAIYDAISVYGTGHMLSLADGAIGARLPVMLLVPTRAGTVDAEIELDADGVVIIGLGDAIIPGMLVGAAVAHGPGTTLLGMGLSLTPAAIGALVGTLGGLVFLFVSLSRRAPQPGLPFLNAGALVGYLAGALVDGIPVAKAIGFGLVRTALVG